MPAETAPHLETDALREEMERVDSFLGDIRYLAGFRAGRTAMKLEVLRALVDMMDERQPKEEKQLIMDACERVERIGAEEK